MILPCVSTVKWAHYVVEHLFPDPEYPIETYGSWILKGLHPGSEPEGDHDRL